MKLKATLVAVPVAAALALGVTGGPAVFSAGSATSAPVSTATETASTEQAAAAARAIAAAIRALGSGAVRAAKAALRSYEAFQTWWAGLPWYIRALGAGLNLFLLFTELKNIFDA